MYRDFLVPARRMAQVLAGLACAVLPCMAFAHPFFVGTTGPLPGECSFAERGLPADFVVLATGTYGKQDADYSISENGARASRVDVAVNHVDRPVVVIVSAYNPTVWNFGWTQGTRIVGVLASGYHPQAIARLPRDVPILHSS